MHSIPRVKNVIDLNKSEERYRTLFTSMDQGFCTIEVIFDENKNPIDYRFLEVNTSFEKQTGLKDARGKRMRELTPNHEQHWFDIYGQIALTGESKRFENRAEALGRWFEVYAFRIGLPENRQVAIFFNDVTERKRIEEATRESNERLQLALSAGQFGDWSWEAATDLVSLSPRAAEVFGLPTGKAITRTALRELLHPEDRELARLAVEKALADRSDYKIEYRITRLSGPAWIATSGRGIYSNKTILGMTGVVQDITAQREIEEALRQSEERFRASFNQAAVGMAIAELDGRFEQVNERFTEILGYSQEELYRLTFRDLSYPDDIPATETAMRRLMAGEIKEYEIEKRYRRKDGDLVWSLTNVTILRDAQGQPDRFIGVIEDITKRKHAEEGLRRSEEELRALANSIPQLAWMAEPDGHIFWYNSRWYEYTGSTLAQMLGWGWQSVHHPDHLARILPVWKQALASGEPWEDTFPLRGADGEYRRFLSRAFPIRDAEGSITRWFGTNTDVEEVKRTQDALSQAQEKLELRVAERTAKLSEAVAQMEEFSYTISHDLRAPLRGMQAYSKALLEDCSDILASKPHAIEYLQRIANNAIRLDKMALDVLTFSRVARGELRLEPVLIDKLVRDLVEDYPAMRPPNAEIQIEPLADVIGHEPSLAQVMSNLLTNAIKFVTPGTTPKIRVWTEKRDGEVRIWVEDSGIGIDPKYQHRLFRMFERIHPDLNCEGTGVGLAVVRKAAERMNGTVGVISDGKKGSRFWIQLQGA